MVTSFDRPYLIPGSPAGVYRLWLWRASASPDSGAVAVLTELPADPGPGLVACAGPIATAALRDFALPAGSTIWAVRNVLADRREMFATVEFELMAGRILRNPRFEQDTRLGVEILIGGPLPPVADDEVPAP